MTKISILYTNHKSSRFDMRYYVETHMPLAIRAVGVAAGIPKGFCRAWDWRSGTGNGCTVRRDVPLFI